MRSLLTMVLCLVLINNAEAAPEVVTLTEFSSIDLDPNKEGLQILEGSTIYLRGTVDVSGFSNPRGLWNYTKDGSAEFYHDSVSGGESTTRIYFEQGSENSNYQIYINAYDADVDYNNRVYRRSSVLDVEILNNDLLPIIDFSENQFRGPMIGKSRNPDGWTEFEVLPETTIVYVSESGDDANDGLSIGNPVRTIGHATTLVQTGEADQILLKKGDTLTGGIYWNLSGKSVTHPIVLGSYGVGAPPIVNVPSSESAFRTRFNTVQYVAIQGIHFYSYERDYTTRSTAEINDPNYDDPDTNWKPNPGSGYGISILAHVNPHDVLDESLDPGNILFEGTRFSYFTSNSVQTASSVKNRGFTYSNIQIRRSILERNYSVSSHSQGLYTTGVNGLLIEETIADHNGFAFRDGFDGSRSTNQGAATVFNHNFYLSNGTKNLVFRNNISSRASATGLQARTGGFIDNNLFLETPIALNFGHINGSSRPIGGVFGAVRNNIILNTNDINTNQKRGGAVEVGNINNLGVLIEKNIVAHDISGDTNSFAFRFRSEDGPWGIVNSSLINNLIYQQRGQHLRLTGDVNRFNGLVIGSNVFLKFSDLRDTQFIQIQESPEIKYYKNTYHDEARTENRFLVDGVSTNFNTWKNNIAPSDKYSLKAFTDTTRSPASYSAAEGGTNSTDGFIEFMKTRSMNNWHPKYTTQAVLSHICEGFDMCEEDFPPEPKNLRLSIIGD